MPIFTRFASPMGASLIEADARQEAGRLVVAADWPGSYSGGQALKSSLLSMERAAVVASPPDSR